MPMRKPRPSLAEETRPPHAGNLKLSEAEMRAATRGGTKHQGLESPYPDDSGFYAGDRRSEFEEALSGKGGGAVNKEFMELLDETTGVLYGEKFEKLMTMFKKVGPDGFPNAMSLAVNDALDTAESKRGKEASVESLMMAGLGLFGMLASDVERAGIVPGLSEEHMKLAIAKTQGDWMRKHPDRTQMEEAIGMLQQYAKKNGMMGNQSPEQKSGGLINDQIVGMGQGVM